MAIKAIKATAEVTTVSEATVVVAAVSGAATVVAGVALVVATAAAGAAVRVAAAVESAVSAAESAAEWAARDSALTAATESRIQPVTLQRPRAHELGRFVSPTFFGSSFQSCFETKDFHSQSIS